MDAISATMMKRSAFIALGMIAFGGTALPAQANQIDELVTQAREAGLFTVILQVYTALILAELVWRFWHGALLPHLIRDGFDEVVSIRWGLYGVQFACFAISAAAAVLTARGLWALFFKADAFKWELLNFVFYPLVACLAAFFLAHQIRKWIDTSNQLPKTSRIEIRNLKDRIDPSDIANLGHESYPACTRTHGHMHWIARAVLLSLLAVAIASLLVLGTDKGFKAESGIGTIFGDIHSFYITNKPSLLSDFRLMDYIVPYAATALLVIFTFTNKHYLYFKSRTALLVIAILCLISGYWIVHSSGKDDAAVAMALILVFPAIRLIMDIYRHIAYHNRRVGHDPISAKLGQVFAQELPMLAARVPEVGEADLVQRLQFGADNINQAEILVPPRFARYMKKADIQWQRCSCAVVRCMTVERWVDLANQRPTFEPLNHPVVRAWDERLFPLNVPSGYVTTEDRLQLPPQWCVVKICWHCSGSGRITCSTCGGSGSVTRQETRTENGKSETVT